MTLGRFVVTPAIVALAVVAACWRSSSPPARPDEPPPPMPAVMHAAAPKSELEQLFEDLNGFADDLCNCSDSPCVQRVTEEITRWSQDHAHDDEAPKMSDEDSKKMAEIGERMGRCMQNAMTGSGAGSGTP